MARRARRYSFLLLPIVVGAMAGTHACSTPVTKGDSESHFLAECVATCADGLQCVCGVCTRTCSVPGDCTAIDARAECAAELEPACAALGKTCDVACLADDACASLGQGYACVGGRCRGAVVHADASTGGQPGGGGVDAGSGGVSAAGSGGAGGRGGSDGCAHTTYPPAPTVSQVTEDGGAKPPEDLEFVVAQYNADLGDSAPNPALEPTGYRSIGLDLDRLCTSSATLRNAECVLPSYATGVVDGPGGIDNAFGTFVQFLRDRISNFSSDVYSLDLQRGATNMIIHVAGYNGRSNDDVVRVDVLLGAISGGVAWSGSDPWPIWSDSVISGDSARPKFVDSHAYVTGNKLVVSLPVFEYRLVTNISPTFQVNLPLQLHGASLVCDVTQSNIGRWGFALQGCTLAARLRANDLIHLLSQFQDPLTPLTQPGHLCADSNAYAMFKGSICGLIDTHSGPAGATTPCDSLSLGIRFDTKPAEIGTAFHTDNPSFCPQPTEPANDSCESLLLDGGGVPPFTVFHLHDASAPPAGP